MFPGAGCLQKIYTHRLYFCYVTFNQTPGNMPLRYISFLNILKVVTEGPEKHPLCFSKKVENSDLLRGLHRSDIQPWDSDVDARKRRDEKQLLVQTLL